MSTAEQTELKGGHPPAVKAGGMRITQSGKQVHEKPEKDEDAEEYVEATSPPKKNDVRLLVSGVLTKGNKDFTTEAVRNINDKPMPKHEKHVDNKPKGKGLNQPRK
ncbi:death-associated protein 1-like [Anneissia japonica]|uniref:death-associated protein 1-like n=1 Tax=Anneissia japonica TaxID=1529436 RepID=UPI00142599E3|nr:death-associated protein 1-like [Anneissia japonica]